MVVTIPVQIGSARCQPFTRKDSLSTSAYGSKFWIYRIHIQNLLDFSAQMSMKFPRSRDIPETPGFSSHVRGAYMEL